MAKLYNVLIEGCNFSFFLIVKMLPRNIFSLYVSFVFVFYGFFLTFFVLFQT